MRLFIIPISTRRALIYCRPLRTGTSNETSVIDRITGKAAETWAKWEEADKGWKKKLVDWGNRVQQRIPFEEWGLKSIPSLNSQRRLDESHGSAKVDVLFPGNAIREEKLQALLRRIATERQDLHRRRMWWSFLATPLTGPMALIPVYVLLFHPQSCIATPIVGYYEAVWLNDGCNHRVPNIPFLYLVYRGWSHWRALNGSKHLEFLVEKDLLKPVSYPGLEQLYAKRVPRALEHSHVEKPISQMAEDVENSKDTLLLRMTDAKKLATILDAPELALEAERAIVQAEEQLQAQKKEEQEKNAPQKKHV